MNPPDTTDYTVDFGRIARTIDYEDSQGKLEFTFDLNSAEENGVFLEIDDESERASSEERYDLAVARAAKFLESWDYSVSILDPRDFDAEAAEERIQQTRKRLIAEGTLTMEPFKSSERNGLSLYAKAISLLKRFFK